MRTYTMFVIAAACSLQRHEGQIRVMKNATNSNDYREDGKRNRYRDRHRHESTRARQSRRKLKRRYRVDTVRMRKKESRSCRHHWVYVLLAMVNVVKAKRALVAKIKVEKRKIARYSERQRRRQRGCKTSKVAGCIIL